MAIRYIDSEEVRNALPYSMGSEEYLRRHRNDLAYRAFLTGKNWRPSSYEYGTNAGNYSSPLESRDGKLWYHRVRQEHAMVSVIIAEVVSMGRAEKFSDPS